MWDNKTTPTNSDNSLRSSAGFGFKYYSPIGPIGFTWGFPLMDKEYDIKAQNLLNNVFKKDQKNSKAWFQLAIAEARLGNIGKADFFSTGAFLTIAIPL